MDVTNINLFEIMRSPTELLPPRFVTTVESIRTARFEPVKPEPEETDDRYDHFRHPGTYLTYLAEPFMLEQTGVNIVATFLPKFKNKTENLSFKLEMVSQETSDYFELPAFEPANFDTATRRIVPAIFQSFRNNRLASTFIKLLEIAVSEGKMDIKVIWEEVIDGTGRKELVKSTFRANRTHCTFATATRDEDYKVMSGHFCIVPFHQPKIQSAPFFHFSYPTPYQKFFADQIFEQESMNLSLVQDQVYFCLRFCNGFHPPFGTEPIEIRFDGAPIGPLRLFKVNFDNQNDHFELVKQWPKRVSFI